MALPSINKTSSNNVPIIKCISQNHVRVWKWFKNFIIHQLAYLLKLTYFMKEIWHEGAYQRFHIMMTITIIWSLYRWCMIKALPPVNLTYFLLKAIMWVILLKGWNWIFKKKFKPMVTYSNHAYHIARLQWVIASYKSCRYIYAF